jgi:hypothetical protein
MPVSAADLPWLEASVANGFKAIGSEMLNLPSERIRRVSSFNGLYQGTLLVALEVLETHRRDRERTLGV